MWPHIEGRSRRSSGTLATLWRHFDLGKRTYIHPIRLHQAEDDGCCVHGSIRCEPRKAALPVITHSWAYVEGRQAYKVYREVSEKP